jgi:hypothetical protein
MQRRQQQQTVFLPRATSKPENSMKPLSPVQKPETVVRLPPQEVQPRFHQGKGQGEDCELVSRLLRLLDFNEVRKKEVGGRGSDYMDGKWR